MTENSFPDLIRRVRAGDQEAATALFEQYGEQIRRIIRVRLNDRRLRRVVDSVDICQSVMANFFLRTVAGQFELETPEQLVKLLATMARNKLINTAQYYQSGRRDIRRVTGGDEWAANCADTAETPSMAIANDELVQKIRALLSEDERTFMDRRAEGRSWAEIAEEFGVQPDAVRKRLARATDRVAAELEREFSC